MLLGGWDYGMQLLVILMIVDYFSGITTAIYGKSTKTKKGKLSSRAGFAGLFRKMMELSFVLIGYHIDLAFGVGYVRDAIIVGFCCNELISITENAAVLGIPLPNGVKKALELLKSKDIKDEEQAS